MICFILPGLGFISSKILKISLAVASSIDSKMGRVDDGAVPDAVEAAAAVALRALSTAPDFLKMSQRKTWPPMQRTGPWRLMASVVTKPCLVHEEMVTVFESFSLNMFMKPEIAESASSLAPGVGMFFWRKPVVN